MQKIKATNLSSVLKTLFSYLMVFVFTYLFSAAEVFGTVGGVFGISFGLALVFCNVNMLLCFAPYYLGLVLQSLTIINFLVSSIVGAILIIIYFAITKFNIKFNKIMFLICSVVAFLPKILLNNLKNEDKVELILLCAIGVIFAYLCVLVIKLFSSRHLKLKFNVDEQTYFYVFACVLLIGVCNINIHGFCPIFFVAALMSLILPRIFNSNVAAIASSLCGLSYAIANNNLKLALLFNLYALVCLIFKNLHVIFSVVALIVADVFFNAFFLDYAFSLSSFLSIVVAGFICLLITQKNLLKIKNYLLPALSETSVMGYLEKERILQSQKLHNIAEVFTVMENVFYKLVKQNVSEDTLKEMMVTEIKCGLCANCINKHKCYSSNNNAVINNVVETSFKRGRATLLDVPQFLTTNCEKINAIINKINELIKSAKQSQAITDGLNDSRLLIASELNGIAGILNNLSVLSAAGTEFDVVHETQIKENLNYVGIMCSSATVVKENNMFNAVLVVNSGFNEGELVNVCNKTLKRKCEIVSVQPHQMFNQQIVEVASCGALDFVFGKACTTKTGSTVSGDVKTAIKMENGKYMVAVSDGMGSGEEANNVSTLALTLIENFYKAGFSDDVILTCVNKLLGSVYEDCFSAMDLCVMDFALDVCNFIKLGATYSLIKRGKEVISIDNSGLPMGAVENVNPHITQEKLLAGDYIIMFSDGVTDAFPYVEDLKTIVSNLKSTNPQTMANDILNLAIKNFNGFPKDDMTVIVLKIYKN